MFMRSWQNKPLLKQGGAVILISKCDGHIDTEKHPSYAYALKLFREAGSAAAFEERHFENLYAHKRMLEQYHACNAYHPVHPVWLFNENQYALDHAGTIIIATAENPEAPAQVGADYAATFDDAMKQALEVTGSDPRILVLPNFFSYAPMLFLVE
jgi:hypothetical protein